METEILKIEDPLDPQLTRAAAMIRAGKLVVFPTETVYGIGGDAQNGRASRKIYKAKGRPSDNPLIVHVAFPGDAALYAYTSPLYDLLAQKFMPGPLTVIMPRRESIPLSTTGGLDTVAIRCPSHPIAHELIRRSGGAIAAPSANLSGKPSPTRVSHVINDLKGRVHMIIDGGDCEIGLESTIVKIDRDESNNEYLTLLRPGAITRDALLPICSRVEIADAVCEKFPVGEHPLSPGMKYKHYAPTAPLTLLEGNDDDIIRFLRDEQAKGGCAILCYDEDLSRLENQNLLPIGKRDDIETQAHNLFAGLRDADALPIDRIYAHLPVRDGIGLALYNRLIRAAAHTVCHIPSASPYDPKDNQTTQS